MDVFKVCVLYVTKLDALLMISVSPIGTGASLTAEISQFYQENEPVSIPPDPGIILATAAWKPSSRVHTIVGTSTALTSSTPKPY